MTVEKIVRIWNDEFGECIEIGNDRDDLGLTEIRALTSKGEVVQYVMFPADHIPAIIAALQARFEKAAP